MSSPALFSAELRHPELRRRLSNNPEFLNDFAETFDECRSHNRVVHTFMMMNHDHLRGEEAKERFNHNVELTFYHCDLTSQYQAHAAQQKMLQARKQPVVPGTQAEALCDNGDEGGRVGASNGDDDGDPHRHLTRTLTWRAAVTHAKERVDPSKYYSAKLYGDFALDCLSDRLAHPLEKATISICDDTQRELTALQPVGDMCIADTMPGANHINGSAKGLLSTAIETSDLQGPSMPEAAQRAFFFRAVHAHPHRSKHPRSILVHGTETSDIAISLHTLQSIDITTQTVDVAADPILSASTTPSPICMWQPPLKVDLDTLRGSVGEWEVAAVHFVLAKKFTNTRLVGKQCPSGEAMREVVDKLVAAQAFPNDWHMGQEKSFSTPSDEEGNGSNNGTLQALRVMQEHGMVTFLGTQHGYHEWQFTQKGIRDLELRICLKKGSPLFTHREGVPPKNMTMFELLDYLHQQGFEVLVLQPRQSRNSLEPYKLDGRKAIYVRPGAKGFQHKYLLALASAVDGGLQITDDGIPHLATEKTYSDMLGLETDKPKKGGRKRKALAILGARAVNFAAMLDDEPQMHAIQDGTAVQWSADQLDQASTRKRACVKSGHERQRPKKRGSRPQKRLKIEAANDGVQDLEDKHVHDAGDESHCNDDQDHNATDVEKGDASSDVVDEADSNATNMEEDEDGGQDDGRETSDKDDVQSGREGSDKDDVRSDAAQSSSSSSSSSSTSSSSTDESDKDRDTTEPSGPTVPEPRQTRPRGHSARPAQPPSFYWRQFLFQWRTTSPTHSWTVCCPYHDRPGVAAHTQACARTIRLPIGVGAYDPRSLDVVSILKNWALAAGRDDVEGSSETNKTHTHTYYNGSMHINNFDVIAQNEYMKLR